MREGYRESRRCSRDTYPASYITKNTSVRRETVYEEITKYTCIRRETTRVIYHQVYWYTKRENLHHLLDARALAPEDRRDRAVRHVHLFVCVCWFRDEC